jgi:hypothetical protein
VGEDLGLKNLNPKPSIAAWPAAGLAATIAA